MSRIIAQRHLDPILAPLPAAEDGLPEVGRRLDDDADYAWLDEEMMKIGSLRHAEVDWRGAEARAVRLLSEEGKDLKVLGHLLHCLQREDDGVRFALSLRLLGETLGHWWNDAWPFQGPRGARARQRQFVQIAQRSARLAAALDFSGAEAERQACHTACAAVVSAAETHELPLDDLVELRRTLDSVSAHTLETESTAQKPPNRHDDGDSSIDEPAVPRMPEVRLESGNERDNRQALLKMADFLTAQSPDEPLGYRLRRYAVWHAIHALPGTRDGARTELAPVAADRVAEYRDGLARGADPALWQRIEASLALSPYWLEGHRLSAETAEALGHSCCAGAIHEEAARFVERLPGLDSLSFNDGAPFLDATTRHWLDSAPSEAAAPFDSGNGEPWQVGLEEARERLADDGLRAALGVLDAGLVAARSPRAHAYWRLASAELLGEAGLAALAQEHYQALAQTLEDIDLARWEPALLTRLEASLAT